jgi:hypothetical protein
VLCAAGQVVERGQMLVELRNESEKRVTSE